MRLSCMLLAVAALTWACGVGSSEGCEPGGARTTDDGLHIVDVECASGAVAARGDLVSVAYTSNLEDGSEIESFGRGRPFEFRLGDNAVIAGLESGVTGMAEGSRRMLVVPPALAYGASGYPPRIPAGATLRIQVEMVALDRARSAG